MNIDNDYNIARANFHDIINTGGEALEELLQISVKSQHPRAYEVLSTTMKTLVDANRELVNLSRELKNDIEQKKNTSSYREGNTTNNLYVGTPDELMEVLDTLHKKK